MCLQARPLSVDGSAPRTGNARGVRGVPGCMRAEAFGTGDIAHIDVAHRGITLSALAMSHTRAGAAAPLHITWLVWSSRTALIIRGRAAVIG